MKSCSAKAKDPLGISQWGENVRKHWVQQGLTNPSQGCNSANSYVFIRTNLKMTFQVKLTWAKTGNLLTFIQNSWGLRLTSDVAGIRGQIFSISQLCSPSHWLYSQTTCDMTAASNSNVNVLRLKSNRKESLFSRSSFKSVLAFTLTDLPLNQLMAVTRRTLCTDCLRLESYAPSLNGVVTVLLNHMG